MGGGDLNSKKAWHPNNLKNQERVWKAEQAAAEEKKTHNGIAKERAEERDKEELNEKAKCALGGSSSPNENRLNWMYDKPDKNVQQEDYLLGKSVDTNHSRADKASQDIIPAVARRVVGSSMLPTSSDTQVDLTRKLREDPLLLIKERERAARAALLNNPLHRRRITELLRKEQDQSKESKEQKKSKRKTKDLDNILAAKLNALVAKKGADLATLLASDDSSSDSSSEEDKPKKKKKDKNTKKKRKKNKKETKKETKKESKEELWNAEKEKESRKKSTEHKRRKSNSDNESDDLMIASKKHRRDATVERKIKHKEGYVYKNNCGSNDDYRKGNSSRNTSMHERVVKQYTDRGVHKSYKRTGMSEEEKAAKLAEMAVAGADREVQRGRRVAEQLAAKEASENSSSHFPRYSTRNEAHALPDSLESRIHSNRHYIQRDRRHMDEHFARR